MRKKKKKVKRKRVQTEVFTHGPECVAFISNIYDCTTYTVHYQ